MKVVSMKPRKLTPRQFQIQIDQIRSDVLDSQDELLLECRRVLNLPGVVWEHIAREAGITGTTLRKLAHAETTAPRFLTVLGVLRAMGYTITVSEPGQGGRQKVCAEAPPFEKKVAETRRRLSLVSSR